MIAHIIYYRTIHNTHGKVEHFQGNKYTNDAET